MNGRRSGVEPIEVLAVAVDDDADRSLLALAASDEHPDDVLIIARAKRFTAEDAAQGTDTYCIVTGSSGATHYGGVDDLEWTEPQRLLLTLDRAAAEALALPRDLELVLPDLETAELVRGRLPALLA